MIAGTAAALPAVAALAAVAVSEDEPDADLLRRLGHADRCWADFVAARDDCERLFDETYYHPEFSHPRGISEAGKAEFDALAERTGYNAAAARCERLHEGYLDAARGAFDLPARSLAGVGAKLRFGVAVARGGMIGSFDDNEFEWFDLALDDFERLSRLPLPERGARIAPAGTVTRDRDAVVAALGRQYRMAVDDLTDWIAAVETRYGPGAYDDRPECRPRYAELTAREDRTAAQLAQARPDSVAGLAAKLRAAFWCDDLRNCTGECNTDILLPALANLERLARSDTVTPVETGVQVDRDYGFRP